MLIAALTDWSQGQQAQQQGYYDPQQQGGQPPAQNGRGY
jgi:hypothetical protein